jgi:quinohemoprotein ethanol dehydrogenase
VPGTAAYRYGNAGRIVAFKLGGGEVPLPEEISHSDALPRPALERWGTSTTIDLGNTLFERHCTICHKNNAAAGTAPDLRRMSAQTQAQFEKIVLGGIRAEKGMGSFASVLSADEVNAIHAALVDTAWREYKRENPDPHSPAAMPTDPPAVRTDDGHSK